MSSPATGFGETCVRLIRRTRPDLRVPELASELGLARSTVYRHLSGDSVPLPSTRARYARFFGLTPSALDLESAVSESGFDFLVAFERLGPAEQLDVIRYIESLGQERQAS